MNQSHQAKSKKIETIEPEDFFDVLIIGGGLSFETSVSLSCFYFMI